MSLTTITEYSEVVDVSIEEIWAVLTAWGCERLWMPDCIKSSIDGIGIGAVRHLVFGETPDVKIEERLEAIDVEKHTLRFKISRSDYAGLENYADVILTVVDGSKTRFTWIGESTMMDENFIVVLKERLDDLYGGFIKSIVTKLRTPV